MKISKMLFCCILLNYYMTNSKAQDSKNNHIIGVASFTSSNETQKSQATELQEIITEVLSKKTYITLLDRSKVEQLEMELKKQKQGNYVEGKTVEQNHSYGAQELLNGTLTNLDAIATTTNTPEGVNFITKKKMPATSVTTYQSKVSFALQLVSVETGQVYSGKAFDINSTGSGFMTFDAPPSYDSKNAALTNAIKNSKKQIVQLVNYWISSVFPPPIILATIDTRKKSGVPETVSLIGGTEANLLPGNDLLIYEVQNLNINGSIKQKKIEIGALKVKEQQGDFTLCKVTEGEAVLESKWKEGNLQIILKPQK